MQSTKNRSEKCFFRKYITTHLLVYLVFSTKIQKKNHVECMHPRGNTPVNQVYLYFWFKIGHPLAFMYCPAFRRLGSIGVIGFDGFDALFWGTMESTTETVKFLISILTLSFCMGVSPPCRGFICVPRRHTCPSEIIDLVGFLKSPEFFIQSLKF